MTDKKFDRLISDGKIMLADLRKRIRSIDPDLLEYCDDNIKKPSAHGRWERLAVVRFLKYFYKYSFDTEAYSRYVRFAEALPIPSDKGMKAFPLVPFQKFFIANIHGWVNADGTRVIRDALLYVPRKASKTSLISQLACYDLLFGPPDGQIFVASNSFNQAGVCFKIISSCVKAMDPKMKYFRRNRETITNVMQGRQSYVQCLSSSPDRLDGLNASPHGAHLVDGRSRQPARRHHNHGVDEAGQPVRHDAEQREASSRRGGGERLHVRPCVRGGAGRRHRVEGRLAARPADARRVCQGEVL